MKKITSLILLVVTLITFNIQFVFAQSPIEEKPWSKYPDNSQREFLDVNSFYTSIDKNQYEEYKNAKLNIRETVYFKDINKILSKADKYGKTRTNGNGFHPKRQVYVFVTVSADGKQMKKAVFDAETQRLISASWDH
ncbi:hypothetical protein [Bacillus massiliigorillae]|uniref:hypothetical protein n=1 Tax=Bacillus massiliigorillae TaxID=1243664 RepID=UPI00039DD2DE|nr:hypothetical protein [Bacillus massiliigorillae]